MLPCVEGPPGVYVFIFQLTRGLATTFCCCESCCVYRWLYGHVWTCVSVLLGVHLGVGSLGQMVASWWFLFVLPGGWQPHQQQSEASLLSLSLVLFQSDRDCSLEGTNRTVSVLPGRQWDLLWPGPGCGSRFALGTVCAGSGFRPSMPRTLLRA